MGGRELPGPRRGLRGSVVLPSSKSLTNRALVAAAVAGGGVIEKPLDCDDTRVLAKALATAGWQVAWDAVIEVGERSVPDHRVRLDLVDSGTGSRLVLALLAASPGRFVLDGSKRLRERPLAPLLEACRALGAKLDSSDDRLPVSIDGCVLDGGKAEVRPVVSSQFVSALALAGPLMRRGLDLTIEVLRSFGAELEVDPGRRRWRVRPTPLKNTRYSVEGDWSAAAFVLAAVAVAGGEIIVGPLDPASRQGDRAVVRILGDAGLELNWTEDGLLARGPITAPISCDLRDAPDLFPALAVVGACAPPGSYFTGLDHLRHKESDRLSVMVDNLTRLGTELAVRGSELEITATLRPTSEHRRVVAAADHRIAMAMAVAALAAGPLELDDPRCVGKSFPDFWQTWEGLVGEGA
jgi:3-phosphoshikimate 1-carboxyvinyltransferase